MQHGDTGQRDDSCPGWETVAHARFHHATQNSAQLKMNELFISGILHGIFLDCR